MLQIVKLPIQKDKQGNIHSSGKPVGKDGETNFLFDGIYETKPGALKGGKQMLDDVFKKFSI